MKTRDRVRPRSRPSWLAVSLVLQASLTANASGAAASVVRAWPRTASPSRGHAHPSQTRTPTAARKRKKVVFALRAERQLRYVRDSDEEAVAVAEYLEERTGRRLIRAHVAVEDAGVQRDLLPASRQRRIAPEQVTRDVLHGYSGVGQNDHARACRRVVRDRRGATGAGAVVHHHLLAAAPEDVPAHRL